MTKEQEQEQEQALKNLHSNFLAIPEMKVLMVNLQLELANQIDWILDNSIYGKTTDTELRNKAARAKSLRETINYVQDYKSLVRSS